MIQTTTDLAWSITRASSKQSYYIARLMVDKNLVSDCYRAYAYFRWVDDVVDRHSESRSEGISFVNRQKQIIDRLYKNERPDDLTIEETMIADLVANDKGTNSGLKSYIYNFLSVIEFDAHRIGRQITQEELTWYSDQIGKSVTDAIQYFVGHGHPYPETDNRYLAATAAHITHMLRDLVLDIDDGYINITREYLEAHGTPSEDFSDPTFRAWVKERVKLARRYFHDGKQYLDMLDVLRCKIVGYWYCVRFEVVLDAIERDDYLLRASYNERRKLVAWFKIIWLAILLTFQHFFLRGLKRRRSRDTGRRRRRPHHSSDGT